MPVQTHNVLICWFVLEYPSVNSWRYQCLAKSSAPKYKELITILLWGGFPESGTILGRSVDHP